jgi:hypothetical protein
VRNALILGIMAGVLEIIPNIGPTIAAIPAVLIAYFQGSTYLPLSNGWFALLVIGIYVVIQQVENNILVPRIIGRSLNLHPLVVIIGAIAGARLAGILGMFLAAPMLASLRILGNYVYCKLLDLEPFDEPVLSVAEGLRASSFGETSASDSAEPRPLGLSLGTKPERDEGLTVEASVESFRASSLPVQEVLEEPESLHEEGKAD